MEIEALIKKMKDIYSPLIDFIEATDDYDAELKTLIDVLEKQEILESKEEIQLLFLLISKISDNHHITSNFFDKLEKIFEYLIKDIPSTISYFIPDYTQYNKRILFFLFEKGFVKPDESLLKQPYYWIYPKMKKYLDEKVQKQTEEEILQKYKEEISIFEEKCRIGENDSYICSLIRSDSVEEFIAYVNRTNLSLLTKIEPSVYETNSFLIYKKPTLIQYAAFFGSIQIIRYLKYNKVPLTSSLWLYVIHSNNAELVHFLEENHVKPENTFGLCKNNDTFEDIIIESIKCHHNAIVNYIKDNFYEQTQSCDRNQFIIHFGRTIAHSLNFFFIPNEIKFMICNGIGLSQLCSSLTQITIPSSVTKIGNSAFSYCRSLTQITIPSSVTSIGDYTFEECSSLTQITIPSSVTKIGNYAFSYCRSLTQITIPSSVTSIGYYAFEGCSSLTQITIPSSVTKIGNYAFSGCSSLTQITIPSSVTSIGDYAFEGCSSLTQITIPSSVTSIGEHAFNGIKKLEIRGDIKSIPNSLFSGCYSLTQIVISSTITKIEKYAFYGCSSLTQITIPSSVISIENYAFEGCSSLEQITIPSSVTSIGNSAFYRCPLLSSETIESINRIKSSNNNNSINKPTWKTNYNTSSSKVYSWTANCNNISLMHQNKPHSNNWSNLVGKSNKPKYTWNPNNNTTNKNISTWGANNDKRSSWKTQNNNFTLEDKNNQKLMNEFEIMKMLDHPNILKVVDIIYDDKKSPSIIFEECPTDLNQAIQDKMFSKVQLVFSIYQIAEGMKYIHSHKIIHLNLKPTNILISEDGTIKISDFKNAEKITSENENRENEDIYSFGKIVYFILSGREINDSEKESVLESFQLLARQLIEACFYEELERRPTFEMICGILEQNNFNLISLTQQELKEISKLTSQYQHKLSIKIVI